ncbi:MAG: hypothetical protein ISS71_07260 [Phycisphaerae bacterium]|nr:hypothetical protein [Phycisphaerae bacterium]
MFEKKIPPQYDLQAQQNRKLLLWVECPRSLDVDYDVQDKLMVTFQLYLTEKAGIRPENIIWDRSISNDSFAQDPMKIAQAAGVGYVLLVQVDDYDMVPLNVKNYYSGQMLSRAVLLDADLGIAVWPKNSAAKVVHVGVDLETEGRAATLSRLVSATAHCAVRYLYPCEKVKFKTIDEKISIQDAYEMETF